MTARAHGVPCDAGFTLIEALVAMAVLAVAAGGFVRATEGHIDAIAALEARAAAGWVADNRLAEARLDLPPGPAATAATAATILGRDWHAAVTSAGSDDPDIAALTVTADGAGVRTRLRGFRDTAALAAAAAPPAATDTARLASPAAGGASPATAPGVPPAVAGSAAGAASPAPANGGSATDPTGGPQ